MLSAAQQMCFSMILKVTACSLSKPEKTYFIRASRFCWLPKMKKFKLKLFELSVICLDTVKFVIIFYKTRLFFKPYAVY